MTAVTVRREIRGDVGRVVTPPGTVVSVLLAHLTCSSLYTSITVPVSELMPPKLREVVAAHGHTAWRWLSRAWGGGRVPSLTPLPHGLLENRARTHPPLVGTRTSKATEAEGRDWGPREGGLHALDSMDSGFLDGARGDRIPAPIRLPLLWVPEQVTPAPSGSVSPSRKWRS